MTVLKKSIPLYNEAIEIDKEVKKVMKDKNNLGPVVGSIDGHDIQANQLQRKGWSWGNGYNTPSDGADTNAGQQPVRKLTKDAKSIVIFWSRSGSTKLLASQIAKRTGSDILEISWIILTRLITSKLCIGQTGSAVRINCRA